MKEKAKRNISLLWIAAAVLYTLPLFFAFDYLKGAGAGRAAWFGAFTIMLAAKSRWELRRFRWFWAIIAAIIFLNVPLILFVPWTAKSIPAFMIGPFCLADGVAILAIIQFVEKRMRKGRHASSNERAASGTDPL